jgi:hypothetical protein
LLDTVAAVLKSWPRCGRLAQRESVPFTRERSQVQSLQRPPFRPILILKRRGSSCHPDGAKAVVSPIKRTAIWFGNGKEVQQPRVADFPQTNCSRLRLRTKRVAFAQITH